MASLQYHRAMSLHIPGLSQAGRYHHPNEGYSNYNNPSYAQQQSGQHTSYHQPFGSAQQSMGNRRQTQFASSFPQESLPSHIVPPPATSADPIMSVLAQMMSKLTEVSGRLDKIEGAKAQCSDHRDGRRIELPFQPLANPRNLGQASPSRTHNVNQVHIDSAQEEAHAGRRKT